MSHYSGNIDNFGMTAASLSGPLQARLAAVRDAGFSHIMLTAGELVDHPDGLQAAVATVRESGLRITGLQVLRDFEGLSGPLHDYKIDIAKSMMEICRALGSRLLLVQSSTLSESSSKSRDLARDLRKLAMLAIPMNIKVAYSAIPGAQAVTEFPRAWDIVCEADMPNLGLALGADTFQMFAEGTPIDELEMLDPSKLFLVQLADFLWGKASSAAQFPVFPGEGVNSETIAALVTKLHELGYRGDYSLDACNADYRQMPLPTVAQRARRAALWLGEGVLQRSVPLPNHIRLKRSNSR